MANLGSVLPLVPLENSGCSVEIASSNKPALGVVTAQLQLGKRRDNVFPFEIYKSAVYKLLWLVRNVKQKRQR